MTQPPSLQLIVMLLTRSWACQLQTQCARQALKIEELLDQYAELLIAMEELRAQLRQEEARARAAERARADIERLLTRPGRKHTS